MLSEIKSGVRMKVLVVFLVAVLGCSLAEGGLVSKCDLKDRLMKAIDSLPVQAKQRGLTAENLLAKVICHVELASGFNTSAVTQLSPGSGDHHSREKREAGYEGLFGLAELEDPLTTIQPHTRQRRHARPGPSNARPTPPTSPPQQDEEVWTLYGLFQLSNHLVCSDGTTPSPNICGMDCRNFVDDDTSDDISCLMKIFSLLVEKGFGVPHQQEFRRMIRLIYQEECRDKEASEYFAECS